MPSCRSYLTSFISLQYRYLGLKMAAVTVASHSEQPESPGLSRVTPDHRTPTAATQKRGRDDDAGSGGEKKWAGWPGDNVFRLVVPVQKVGGIIGRKGEFVKKMCEETRARIKILEGVPGTSERIVCFFLNPSFCDLQTCTTYFNPRFTAGRFKAFLWTIFGG